MGEWVIKESCAFKLLDRQERYKRRGVALGNVLINLNCYLAQLRSPEEVVSYEEL